MKLRTIILTVILVVTTGVTTGYAQKNVLKNSIALGYHLTQNQQDFGIGLDVTSPYFAAEKVAIRLKGNLMWNQHLTDENITVWSPYSNVSLGVVGVGGEIAHMIRLYGEGGMVLLFPSKNVSGKTIVSGGYGLFGFEFLVGTKVNYHIEIGGIGTGAVADKVAGKPVYSNGMLINTGFRVYF